MAVFVNVVTDFGAAGNGTTNDWTSINNAIVAAKAAGGGVVYFPPSSPAYSVQSAAGFEVYDNVELRLDKGAFVRMDVATAGAGITFAFVRNNDFTVKLNGFAITGEGKIGAKDTSRTGVILGLWGDDMRLSDFTIDTYAGGQSATRSSFTTARPPAISKFRSSVRRAPASLTTSSGSSRPPQRTLDQRHSPRPRAAHRPRAQSEPAANSRFALAASS